MKKGVLLYYVTAGWALLIVAICLHFLFSSMAPTTDVKSWYHPSVHSISIENWEPGDAKTLIFEGKPIILWRRDLTEIATAMAQVDPSLSRDEWLVVLNDGSLAGELGPEVFSRMEWSIVSPINVGGYGCIVQVNAGDYGGYFDPCQAVHFDMWGRPRKGPNNKSLKVPPSQISEDRQVIIFDLAAMPSMK